MTTYNSKAAQIPHQGAAISLQHGQTQDSVSQGVMQDRSCGQPEAGLCLNIPITQHGIFQSEPPLTAWTSGNMCQTCPLAARCAVCATNPVGTGSGPPGVCRIWQAAARAAPCSATVLGVTAESACCADSARSARCAWDARARPAPLSAAMRSGFSCSKAETRVCLWYLSVQESPVSTSKPLLLDARPILSMSPAQKTSQPVQHDDEHPMQTSQERSPGGRLMTNHNHSTSAL